jgi:hypothetical protein
MNSIIEELKLEVKELIYENINLEKNIEKFEKEEKIVTLENIRINEQIKNQEISSQNFLKTLENKVNKILDK